MMEGRIISLWWIGILCFCLSNGSRVSYKILSNVYLPYTYDPSPAYALGEDATEQVAYDKHAKIIYSIGKLVIILSLLSHLNSP